jgi:FdhE protein
LTSGAVRRAGGPGDFAGRRARAVRIEASAATAAPLSLLVALLEHQAGRAASPKVAAAAALIAEGAAANLSRGIFPLLELFAAQDELLDELDGVVRVLNTSAPALPEPLAAAGRELTERDPAVRSELLSTWLDDPSLLDPRFGFWIGAGCAPILETAAAAATLPPREQWNGAACPVCGGPPQVSVIAEQSGEFMAGSPRWLVCSRCATWWPFARAVCPACGEDDSRKLAAYAVEDLEPARIDACDACRAYIKSFDLRRPGGRDTVPLVDDVATLALDLWAHEQGLHRSARSLAGV